MRNRTLVMTIALLALIAFGSASTADAFVDPMTIALVLAGTFAAAVSIVKMVKNHNKELVTVQPEAPTSEKRTR